MLKKAPKVILIIDGGNYEKGEQPKKNKKG